MVGANLALSLGSSLPLRDWMKKGDNYDSFLSSTSVLFSLFIFSSQSLHFMISMWFPSDLRCYWGFDPFHRAQHNCLREHLWRSAPTLTWWKAAGSTWFDGFTMFFQSSAWHEVAFWDWQRRKHAIIAFMQEVLHSLSVVLWKLCKALFEENHLQRLVNQLVKCSFQYHFCCLGFL